ncbi:tetratricopeptide repeat protein [Spirosoma spitsbergense]|uniref:tetratricopeptide repeat protein n=1 Tax=Spirosoma spitsbergense TaxID=431554 RepID=UPI0003643928|nr:tetratricopeptide repeat protein [Spirosoma spitsbergense]
MKKVIIFLLVLEGIAVTIPITSYAQKLNQGGALDIQRLFLSADALTQQSRYDSATVQLMNALRISSKANLKSNVAIAYDKLAELNQNIGKLKEMQTFDSLSLPIIRQLKDTTLLINVYNRAGIVAMERGKNKEAETHFTAALNLSSKKPASKKTGAIQNVAMRPSHS